jgi:general secretion pathway protein G
VARRYLRDVPRDPITESSETWVLVDPPAAGQGVYDVRSGAPGATHDGHAYDTL